MNEKPVKVNIDFGEALRRIAHTPKAVAEKQLVNTSKRVYNGGKGDANPPTSIKKKRGI